MPVTATRKHGQPDQVIFWFEPGDVEIAQTRMTVDQWLKAFLCPWDEFKLSLDHPAAYLKAAGENRQNLLSYVKDAQAHAFRLVQRGNRTVVASAGMTEANLRRLVGG